jgi:hypothetical protein
MSSTFLMSRAYLQGLPEETRQKQINMVIDHHYNQLRQIVPQTAIAGKTSYLYELKPLPSAHPSAPPPPTISSEDLVEAFKLKFPDCTITYFEDWVLQDDKRNHHIKYPDNWVAEKIKVLKTGILIDWS